MSDWDFTDDGLIYIANGEDDYDIDVVYIPSSWLDSQNVRHVYVWDESIEQRYKLVDGVVDFSQETGVF